MAKLYVGDTGTVIQLDTGQDLSAATDLKIEVSKPDGTVTSWPADKLGTAMRFTTLASTFDQAGTYKVQAHVTAAGGDWRGETAKLVVFDRFR